MNQPNDPMNHARASFGAALRDAADSFPVPQVGELHERAVRRGRQIKRRRTIGTVSAAVAVAAIGSLAASLLSPGASTGSATTPATGSHATTLVPPPAESSRYMAEHLKALLPAGAQLKTGSGMASLSGDGYHIQASNGIWTADAQAFITYSGKAYNLTLSVNRLGVMNPVCGQGLFKSECTSKPLGRGTLVSSLESLDSNSTMWNYSWNLADGTSVALQIGTAAPLAAHPASLYTEQRIEALLTAPAWMSVLAGLPQIVHCDSLEPLTGKGSDGEWICPSTGQKYPGFGSGYATGF